MEVAEVSVKKALLVVVAEEAAQVLLGVAQQLLSTLHPLLMVMSKEMVAAKEALEALHGVAQPPILNVHLLKFPLQQLLIILCTFTNH